MVLELMNTPMKFFIGEDVKDSKQNSNLNKKLFRFYSFNKSNGHASQTPSDDFISLKELLVLNNKKRQTIYL